MDAQDRFQSANLTDGYGTPSAFEVKPLHGINGINSDCPIDPINPDYPTDDEKPSDDVIANAAQLAGQRLPVQGKVVEYLIDRIGQLEAEKKSLGAMLFKPSPPSEGQSFEDGIEKALQVLFQKCEVHKNSSPNGGANWRRIVVETENRLRDLKDKGA